MPAQLSEATRMVSKNELATKQAAETRAASADSVGAELQVGVTPTDLTGLISTMTANVPAYNDPGGNGAGSWVQKLATRYSANDNLLTQIVGLLFAKVSQVVTPFGTRVPDTSGNLDLTADFGNYVPLTDLSTGVPLIAAAALTKSKITPVNAVGGAIVMNPLPALSGLVFGTRYGIEKTDTTANAVTVPFATGDTTLTGASSASLTMQGTAELQVVSNGGTGKFWKVVNHVRSDATFDQRYTPQGTIDSPLYFIGHSFAQAPGYACTAGLEPHNLIAKSLGMPSTITYGQPSRRLVEMAFAMLNAPFDGFVAGTLWPATRRGVLVIDGPFNDYVNSSTSADNAHPSALTPAQINGIAHALRTMLAIASASARTEEPTAPTNWTANSDTNNSWRFSGGSNISSATPGAAVPFPVTVPASGVLYALSNALDPASFAGGKLTYSIGGTTYGTWDQTGAAQFGPLFCPGAGSGAASFKFGPAVTKLTGLPAGAQTITVTKDTGSGNGFVDAFLTPAAQPPLIVYCIDPAPVGIGSVGTAAPLTTAQAAVVRANKLALDPVLAAVCAEFPNVVVVDNSDLVIGVDLSKVDGIHPNDRGMRKISGRVAGAIARYAVTVDPDFAYQTL